MLDFNTNASANGNDVQKIIELGSHRNNSHVRS
jgi:hypothetical protein